MDNYLYELPRPYLFSEDNEGFDYIAETDKTASNVFQCDHVGQAELIIELRKFQLAGERLNKFKKAMFRKQSREEADLSLLDGPGTTDSVDPSLDELVGGMALDDFFHGIIGVCTEAAELAELCADVIEGKRKPDVTNAREEIGDVLWYLSRLVKWADTTFLTEMKRNVAKLRARHGQGGFNKERDMSRDLEGERKLLEGTMEVSESVPDPHCPECGADVDENCENLDNCPRISTGLYSTQDEAEQD